MRTISKFIKTLAITFCFAITVSCNANTYNQSTQQTTLKKIIKLNVAQIKVEGITYLNTYCESGIKTCPKNALIKWIEDRIITKGHQGLLLITINNAVLKQVKNKEGINKYQGIYDVTLRLFRDQRIPNDYVELNAVAENYRLIPDGQNLEEKANTISEQVNELVKLLENEIIEKSNIYFDNYLIR